MLTFDLLKNIKWKYYHTRSWWFSRDICWKQFFYHQQNIGMHTAKLLLALRSVNWEWLIVSWQPDDLSLMFGIECRRIRYLKIKIRRRDLLIISSANDPNIMGWLDNATTCVSTDLFTRNPELSIRLNIQNNPHDVCSLDWSILLISHLPVEQFIHSVEFIELSKKSLSLHKFQQGNVLIFTTNKIHTSTCDFD